MLLWWIKQIVISFISVFFLITGIEILIGSYRLNNPLEFVMYFFSSSMVILVSIAFLAYPVTRIYGRFFGKKEAKSDHGE